MQADRIPAGATGGANGAATKGTFGSFVQADALTDLSSATFEDMRWSNAVKHMKESQQWTSETDLKSLLRQGATSFGFWQLPDATLQMLADHMIKEPSSITPALKKWAEGLGTSSKDSFGVPLQERLKKISVAPGQPSHISKHDSLMTSKAAAMVKLAAPWSSRPKWAIFFVIFCLCNVYAVEVVWVMYPGALDLFGWPIYVARACGIGTTLWTAVVFMTMSRTMFRAILCCLPFSWMYSLVDQHKELHIFSAIMLMIFGALHVLMHSVGTVPGIVGADLKDVNDLIGCANPDDTPLYLGIRMKWLEWPECPLTETPTFLGALFTSTPGLTGVFLCLLLAAMGFTAMRAQRKKNHDLFYYMHSVGIPLWLVLLFLHGSNGWVGVGFPLVVFICSLPVAGYSVDRILRFLRYYLWKGGETRIVDCIVRPGVGGQPMGALAHISVSKPRYLWRFSEGMYAFLSMPEYAPGQWHAMTICSGNNDETVDFIVNAIGDWTCELAKKCMDAYEGKGPVPQIVMDGPFIAPTVTALQHEVIVAVGAGVGVTPFLSLMAAIIALRADTEKSKRQPLKEAHFFWMTKHADELLFGRQLFTAIAQNEKLRGKVFLHLHVTQQEPEKDAAAYLFREAIRRQNVLDREAWFRAAETGVSPETKITSLLPWCWMHGVLQDVLFVNALLDAETDKDSTFENQIRLSHWSVGAPGAASESTVNENFRKGQLSGLRRRGLFGKSAAGSDSAAVGPVLAADQAWLPVVFGRPDFAKEISAIGRAWPKEQVHVYVCGKDSLVQSLQTVCASCIEEAKELRAQEGGKRAQGFFVHYERFD